MEIILRVRQIACTTELREQIERTIEFAVDRHRSRIDRISVCLSDVNGPRGGVDRLCHMKADIRGTRPVMVVERGSDLQAVVCRAARRLGYRIGRRTHRQHAPRQREYRSTIRK